MNKKTILLMGPILSRSGYGSHTRDIANCLLESNKFEIKIISTPWGTTPLTALDYKNPKDQPILNSIADARTITTEPDIFIHITIPNEFKRAGKFSVGITAGIETDLCTPEWIEGCNRMDLVITTSNHSADVFRKSTFEKRDKETNNVVGKLELSTKLEVLFEGIEPTIYKILNKTDEVDVDINQSLSTVTEDFNFLFVGQWIQGNLGEDRKDIGMMVKVFLDTFKKKAVNNRPGLIIKTGLAGYSKPEEFEITKRLNYIRDLCMTDFTGVLPSIYLLHGDLTDSQMNSLYNHKKVKAMISFTKGEGFGRPLLEFASIGKPVLAPKWSGLLDFLSEEHHMLIPGELHRVGRSALNNWIIADAQWHRINYDFAALAMSDIVSNYPKYTEKSRKFVNVCKEKYSMKAMGEKLVEYIETNTAAPEMNTIKLPKLQIL